MNNAQYIHDIKSALRFLENLYEEILVSQNIQELRDQTILKKFKQTIEFLEKTLST